MMGFQGEMYGVDGSIPGKILPKLPRHIGGAISATFDLDLNFTGAYLGGGIGLASATGSRTSTAFANHLNMPLAQFLSSAPIGELKNLGDALRFAGDVLGSLGGSADRILRGKARRLERALKPVQESVDTAVEQRCSSGDSGNAVCE